MVKRVLQTISIYAEILLFCASLVLGIWLLAWELFGSAEGVWSALTVFLGPGLLVYAFTTRLHVLGFRRPSLRFFDLCWGVRRHPFLDLILALVSAYAGFRVTAYLAANGVIAEGGYWSLAGAFVGCIVSLELITVIATPKTAVAVINCSGGNDQIEEGRWHTNKPAYPLVWPYHLAAKRGGSVLWYLHGDRGCQVVITFPEHHRPFGEKQEQYELKGTVPGFIAAGPVLKRGCGFYTVECRNTQGNTAVADPGLDIPKG